MTRAVIKLSGDISAAMPRLSRQIEGCAYNAEAHLLAFRFKDMVVNVESRLINISKIKDEKMVKTFMEWFTSTIIDADKN